MNPRVIAPDLATRYRERGFWAPALLRYGVERVAELDGERVAVIDNRGTSTYAELRRRVEASVGALAAAGVGDDGGVLIVAPNTVESVAAVHGTIRAGGLAMVLDRRCGALDVASAVASGRVGHIVVPAALRATLGVDEHPVSVVELEQLDHGRPDDGWSEPDPSRPRFVVFTSGTTSRAKGVLHSIETMSAATRNLATVMGLTDDDRPFLSSPIGTITGVAQVMATSAGASLVLEDRFDPAGSLDRIEAHGATVIGGAPVVLELLFDECERRGLHRTSLRRISLGGTMIPRSVLEVAIGRFGIEPTRVYGSSEVPVHTASSPTDTLEQRLGDDGVPLPGSECRPGAESGDGCELEVRGPNLFLGYLDETDNDQFTDDGWFRTGDLVELDDGRVRVRGRLKDVVARKGLKISLAEVDAAAEGLPGAVEAAAFRVDDPHTGERVALAVRPDEDATVDLDGVIAGLAAAGLARGKLPEQLVVWRDPLPRNASGKVVRADLERGAAGRPITLAARLRDTAAAADVTRHAENPPPDGGPMTTTPIADQVAIGDLLARYCVHLDHHDVEGWVSLFTADAVYEVYGRTFEGHDGLRTMMEHSPRGLHLGGVPVIDMVDADRARADQSLLFVPVGDEPMRRATYTDDLVRTSKGWRIARRRCRFITPDGLSDRP